MLSNSIWKEEEELYMLRKMRPGMIEIGENFTFKKTGKEISDRIDTCVATVHTEIEYLRSTVAEVCKKREIDFTAAIEEANEEISEVRPGLDLASSRAYSNIAASMSNAVSKAIQEMQSDVNKVQAAAREIVNKKNKLIELERLKNNIEPIHVFTLTWKDLGTFNF